MPMPDAELELEEVLISAAALPPVRMSAAAVGNETVTAKCVQYLDLGVLLDSLSAMRTALVRGVAARPNMAQLPKVEHSRLADDRVQCPFASRAVNAIFRHLHTATRRSIFASLARMSRKCVPTA